MFGDTLMKLRKSKNLTQSDIAKILGVARTTYSSYEQNRRMPDAEIQIKIADYFDVSLDYLHGRSKNNIADTIAAHIDSNASEEDIKEILAYIEEKRKEHVNEEEINITKAASKDDKEVNKFVDENEDFKAVAARIMTDAEAVKAVKSFIEFYEQQKNN
ncbi:helix-turn-helix domain-containing protein [Listeria monocytogenes]|uniref:helix-turn-helix domain-containing protein n=1 Tax=Listeria monocytogenes TaxID=1639 RepID=UPI000D0ABD5C|nr:helix-turn-helix domain-containing protein [Listeria monocytogenes]EAC3199865.1 helix-turn-helix domain-containing protein [Listeria monocytogenes]EAC7678985.1 helix-turn-helix domain-containing protein [Listeria monocytogenes]EAF2083489.1 helix-turn-helix domain-containing protein [Listeria monocytogenes]EAF7984645.1 helix-turn-helix domain-containing protein [Listeria monocytogenes]EAG7636449.1 helix-turn-helix domain-containing protein [Listeria monocytogenes]